MADAATPAPATTPDPSGVPRTPEGQIADASNPTTTPSTSGSETPNASSTLLNEPGQPATAEGEKKPETPDAGAPEAYADFTLPEGFTLDPEAKTEIDTLFKSLAGKGLSQADAQKLIDFYTAKTQEAFNAPYAAFKEMTDGWRKDAENHPDLKGKLGAGKEVNVTIGKLLNLLPDQQLASDFRSLMDLTGAGNHPAFIRAVYHWAQQLTEGGHVAGNGPSVGGQSAGGTAARPSAAQAMWPNLPTQR